MACDHHSPALVHPSLYSTIKLAHHVRSITDRLKSLIQNHDPPPRPASRATVRRPSVCHANDAINGTRPYSKSMDPCRRRRRGSKQILVSELGSTDLLRNLDSCAPMGDFSLCKTAAHDSLFLSHNFRQVSRGQKKALLYRISDLTSALWNRMKGLRRSLALEGEQGYRSFGLALDDALSDRFYANLEHLLRCLLQVVLDAIVSCVFLGSSLAHFFRWSHQQQLANSWFAEWPNAQHPLNTTWPWNIKTALLVLWGVCWMFYGNGVGAGAGAPLDHVENYGQDMRRSEEDRRQSVSASQPLPTAALDHARILPGVAWLQPAQAGTASRRANERNPAGSVYPATQAVYPTGASTYPYITPSPYVSSDLFPASTVAAWPYAPGSNDPPTINVNTAITSSQWQPNSNNSNPITFSDTPQSIESFSPNIVPYDDVSGRKQDYQPHLQTPATQPSSGALEPPFGGFHFPLGLSSNMQNYPSPQYSDVSGPTFTAHQKMVESRMVSSSPAMAVAASPSIAGSSVSRPSSHKSLEPTRNAEGVLYCNHPEHGFHAPTFARKCEWSKHMDKHTRPYTCEEPGCENRGFTYSGGLHRHQREVHNQHGGPKARSMCPYQDCKRSTGPGFSRRENLMEHIRRVHIVPAERIKSQAVENQDVSSPAAVHSLQTSESSSRKRKRRAGEDDGKDEGPEDSEANNDSQRNSPNLRREIKKLRRELQVKDERLRELEQLMEQITKATQTQTQRK